MSHLTDRADVRAYFSSMNPLASKIMGTLSSVKEKTGASWEEMEHEARDALYEAALIPGMYESFPTLSECVLAYSFSSAGLSVSPLNES